METSLDQCMEALSRKDTAKGKKCPKSIALSLWPKRAHSSGDISAYGLPAGAGHGLRADTPAGVPPGQQD